MGESETEAPGRTALVQDSSGDQSQCFSGESIIGDTLMYVNDR